MKLIKDAAQLRRLIQRVQYHASHLEGQNNHVSHSAAVSNISTDFEVSSSLLPFNQN